MLIYFLMIMALSCRPLPVTVGEPAFVMWVFDVTHFNKEVRECGTGICFCREAQLITREQYGHTSGWLFNREVQCKGIITGLRLVLQIPFLINRKCPAWLSLSAPVNIINAEREIVYRILPGTYRLHYKGKKVQTILPLTTE